MSLVDLTARSAPVEGTDAEFWAERQPVPPAPTVVGQTAGGVRYTLQRVDAQPVDPEALFLVLRLDQPGGSLGQAVANIFAELTRNAELGEAIKAQLWLAGGFPVTQPRGEGPDDGLATGPAG